MYANGRLPPSALSQVDGWAYLHPATAASWNAFADEIESLGYPRPSITAPDGAYRTYERQVYWKDFWTRRGLPGNAATPGFSNHGWGTCVDIFNVYRYPRSVIVPVAARWGFTFNVPSESWHMQHNSIFPAGDGATPIDPDDQLEEESNMTVYIRPRNNSSPINGVARVWAGDNRVFGGVSYSGVWELTNPSARRLSTAEWAAIQAAYEAAKRKIPLAEVSGNEAEIIIYAPPTR